MDPTAKTRFVAYLTRYWKELVVGGVSGCGTLLYAYPYTPQPIAKFKEEHSTYTRGKIDIVDMDILNISHELNNKFKWNTKYGRMTMGTTFNFFSYNNLDIDYVGSARLSFGAHIGIPPFYSTKFMKRVEENPQVLLDKFEIDTRTEEGKKLFNLLKLSEDARRFSIGKVMVQANSHSPLVNYTMIPSLTFACIYCSVTLSTLLSFPGSIFCCYMLIIPLFMLGIYRMVDFQSCWAEERAIRRVAKLDENLAKGGLEYYRTHIERRKMQEPEMIQGISIVPRVMCENIIAFCDYFDFKNWFIDYRKPSLSDEERLMIIEEVMQSKYSKKEDEMK